MSLVSGNNHSCDSFFVRLLTNTRVHGRLANKPSNFREYMKDSERIVCTHCCLSFEIAH